MICGSRGSTSRLAKAAGAEPAGHRSDEKLHAVVARSTFRSQKCKKLAVSDHFWKLRCRKSARRCGAKHISKSKVLKTGGLGPLLEVAMSKKCTPLWHEAHFQVKSVKNWRSRTTFGSWDVEKVHAVVARSTFPSQNVQNTPCSDHFWRFRCRKSAARSTFPSQNVQNTPGSDHFWKSRCWKSARRCGAKHISKSKCTKHTMLGPLLEVQMSKKCTPMWREAHLVVKMYKTHHARTTFGSSDVEKVHAVVARSTFRSQNVKNTRVSDHFWRFRCRFASLHYTTPRYTTLHYITLHYTTLHYLPPHFTTLHYTTLHYTTNTTTQRHNYTTTFHYTTFHYTPLHYTTFHYTPLHYTPQHYN